nr:MAG TPA: Protein of unknown function (DUF4051) [Caudoviricetes sp.]
MEDEKNCKTCRHGKDMLYRQRLCQKSNEIQSELYSCPYYEHWLWRKQVTDNGRNQSV